VRSFWVALAFLTTLPAPRLAEPREADPGRAVTAYPLVGLLLGVLLWAAAATAESMLPALPALLRGSLLTALWLALTGALHFDGLCDTADAAFVSRSLAERRRIAADPAVGSFGLASGALLIAVKSAALSALSPAALLAIPVIARTAAVLPMAWEATHPDSRLARSARPTGGEPYRALLIGTAVVLAHALLTGALLLWLALLGVALAAALLGARWLAGRLGGMGGDGYGALIELSEVLLLVLLVAR
jgi:adenosylcobinamide-GDP ribazoletransferase